MWQLRETYSYIDRVYDTPGYSNALDVIKESGDPEVCVLHCVSDYPTDPVDANLGMIKWLKEKL